MILFNSILILHLAAFLLFLLQLAVLFPQQKKELHKKTNLAGVLNTYVTASIASSISDKHVKGTSAVLLV